MSNKKILQKNNLKILENNNNLSSVLDTVNNLPINVKKRLQEKTVIPSTEQQDIVADENYTGLSKVVIAGDEDLIPENIKEGTNIFGVEGVAKTTSAKITNARYLFYAGIRLDYMNELLALCENVTSTESMFYNCRLTELDLSNFDTSNVTNMSYMFGNCGNLTELDVSSFNTNNVTNLQSMFSGCNNLTKLDLSNFDTSNVTNMGSLFVQCMRLTELDVSSFNTSNVTTLTQLFYGNYLITDVDISNFDMSKVINISQMFQNTTDLTNLVFGTNLGKGFTQKTTNYSNYILGLSGCRKLTHDSLMNVINNLYDLNLTYDVANGGTLYTQKLELDSTNLSKLTAEEIAIATNKGWTVS